MADLRSAALSYTRRGWPVFPLVPRDKVPTGGSSGLKEATTNPNLVERWWDGEPELNVGLATGKDMGVWVLDVDGAEGSASLTKLEEELGALPETLDAQTGGGGRHLYFAYPKGREVRNRANVRPGIDVRGEGGYVVAPPSIHKSGLPYMWTSGDTPRGKIAHAPKAWLDLVAPPRPAPWQQVDPRPVRVLNVNTKGPIVERAKLYLAECEPAVQGSGGHNALLWAARALVVGFLLDDATALDLLWSEFNPRCRPPWDESSQKDRRDLERKVGEARRTPGSKPPGWLLDEYGLRDTEAELRKIARGATSAEALMASALKRAREVPIPAEVVEVARELEESGEVDALPARAARVPFPVEHLPGPIQEFVRQAAESHQVDESFLALPCLVVAAAAMGNAWRLKVKEGYVVPTTIWGALIAPSGSNKSAPLRDVVSPLREVLPQGQLEGAMLNPQGQMVMGDSTIEAVVEVMDDNPRGVLSFRDEIGGWVASFDKHRKKGSASADEAAWLEFWNAQKLEINRKTGDKKHIEIPSASACLLGGIQPGMLSRCFNASHFDSGLMSRILVTCPPRRVAYWSESVVKLAVRETWREAILWLRSRPFAGLHPLQGQYLPHMVEFSHEARVFHAGASHATSAAMDRTDVTDVERSFMSKGQETMRRLALVHHGLKLACGERQIRLTVDLDSVQAGVAWSGWCLEEQLRVYGFGTSEARRKVAEELANVVRRRRKDRTVKARDVQNLKPRKIRTAKEARDAMAGLVEFGLGDWLSEKRRAVVVREAE